MSNVSKCLASVNAPRLKKNQGRKVSHETLDVWKTSTELSINLYKTLKTLKDFGFKDQITRSGLSVPSNIAEGMARNSDKEKVYFLAIANGSCAELRTQIYIGIEIGYIDRETGQDWMSKTKRIQVMLKKLSDKIRQ